MKIEKHIAALLYRHQCVTVPGFGAFISEWQSAQVVENQNLFSPPKKIILFNTYIKTNDGLLANHIALQEKISFENAVTKIYSQVEFWNEKLKNKEHIIIENIGEIFSNSENNLVFKPTNSVNYLKESFGLTSFNIPEILRQEETNKEVIIETIIPISEEKEVITLNTYEEIEKTETKIVTINKKSNNNWLKYVASITLFASIGIYGYKMYFDYSVDQKTLIVEKNVAYKINKKIQEATFGLPVPTKAIDLTLKEKEQKYHIVANAFASLNNAKKFQHELINLGYNSIILEKNRYNLYNVTFGSFDKLDNAQALKKELTEKGISDLWLHIK